MWRKLSNWWGVLVVLIVWGVVCLKTYVSGTYLLGWDNFVPELGFGINIQRSLSTAWQEFQGVGLLGGMGHAADLTRQAILWIASFIFPASMLRWGWTLSMLLIGSLGALALGNLYFGTGLTALTGAVFYLLNPVTIQVFNVPFETFTSFYGFAPWMIYTALAYFKNGKRTDLIKLLIVLLVGMSAFVVQTMFIVFVIMMGIFSLEYLIREGNFNRLLKVWGVIVGANLFWLLPVLWFGITSASVNVNAKMNLLATEEVELMNVAYGDVGSVARLNGWWLQNTDAKSDGQMILLMQNWTEWLSGSFIGVVGGVIFVIAGVGLLFLFGKDRRKSLKWSWVLLFILILLMLARRVQGFSYIYDLISQNVPLFGQIFRASYTKWSIPLILALSVGIMSIVGMTGWKFKIIGWVMGVVIMGMATYTVLPVFNEGIVGERMRVDLPSAYISLLKYFSNAEHGRIAKLPVNSLWGWVYNDWGYRGSGFLWYGIGQPILDRAFDVWSPYNEGFYNEFSTALYGIDVSTSAREHDYTKIQNVLQKYDVRYVLLDESVIAPGQDKETLRIEETKKLAEELGWEQKFQEDFLTVWDAESARQHVSTFARDFVSAPESYTWVEGETTKTRQDVIYQDVGTYVQSSNEDSPFAGWRTLLGLQPRIPFKESPLIAYPFAQLMREETANVEYGDVGIRITNNELRIGEGQELEIPGWKQGEWVEVGYELRITNNELRLEWKPIYMVNGQAGPRLQSITNNELRITNGVWVQVGENKAIYVKQDEVVQGSAKLQVGEPIHIKIFDGVGKIEKVIVGDEQQCGDYRCWATPLPKAESDSLVQTITHYEGQVSPEICLDKEGDPYACTNELRQGQSPVVVTTAVHKGERYWLDWVAKDAGTVLKEPGVVVYELDDQWTMDDGQWETFLQNSKFQITNSKLEVEVPGTARVYDFGTLGKRTIANCDVLKRGTADKLQMSTNKQMYTNVGQETGYTADERGAACDYVEMSQLDTRLPYLMRVVGQNVAGRSLKFFLWNTGSKRNDIEALLSTQYAVRRDQGKVFDTTYSLLPWSWDGYYTLNIETRSFGQYAENRLAPVEVRYFPLDKLSRAKFQIPNSNNQTSSNYQIQNNLKIISVRKTGTWLYRVGVRFECTQIPNKQMCTDEQPGLIRLSQGFDNGWVGVQISDQLPVISDQIKILEHVKVDGWANGWMVPSARQHDDTSARTVILFYWPQLLEYIGFVALGFTLIFLFMQRGKRRDTI